MERQHDVQFLKEKVRVDGKELTDEQMEAVVQMAAENGRLAAYLADPQARRGSLGEICSRLVAAKAKGDWAEYEAALSDLLHFALREQGVGAGPAAREGAVPTTRGLGTALRSAAKVVRGFPMESYNGRRDPAELERRAAQIESQEALADLLLSCYQQTSGSVAALAQESVGWVRQLLQAIATAEPGNEPLRAAAGGMHDYTDDPVERAAYMKRALQRARSEAKAEGAAESLDTARSEARAEVRAKLDDQFAKLLD